MVSRLRTRKWHVNTHPARVYLNWYRMNSSRGWQRPRCESSDWSKRPSRPIRWLTSRSVSTMRTRVTWPVRLLAAGDGGFVVISGLERGRSLLGISVDKAQLQIFAAHHIFIYGFFIYHSFWGLLSSICIKSSSRYMKIEHVEESQVGMQNNRAQNDREKELQLI